MTSEIAWLFGGRVAPAAEGEWWEKVRHGAHVGVVAGAHTIAGVDQASWTTVVLTRARADLTILVIVPGLGMVEVRPTEDMVEQTPAEAVRSLVSEVLLELTDIAY